MRMSVAASRGAVVAFFFVGSFKTKPMHPKSPLQADNSSLYDWHQGKCQAECQGQPESGMDEIRWLPNTLHDKHEGDEDMPDNENCEIGRRIVGPLMMQGRAAMAAGAGNFHEF